MLSSAEVPPEIEEVLKAERLNGSPVLVASQADLSLAGARRSHWLVATSDRLAVIQDGAGPALVDQQELSCVEAFRAHATSRLDGVLMDVAHSSREPAAPPPA